MPQRRTVAWKTAILEAKWTRIENPLTLDRVSLATPE